MLRLESELDFAESAARYGDPLLRQLYDRQPAEPRGFRWDSQFGAALEKAIDLCLNRDNDEPLHHLILRERVCPYATAPFLHPCQLAQSLLPICLCITYRPWCPLLEFLST